MPCCPSAVSTISIVPPLSIQYMDLYLAVDKEIPNAENITLSGKFISKVYEGDFKETGKWCKDFEEYLQKKARK